MQEIVSRQAVAYPVATAKHMERVVEGAKRVKTTASTHSITSRLHQLIPNVKLYSCKHSVGLAILFKIYEIRDKTRWELLGKRRGKGRSKKQQWILNEKFIKLRANSILVNVGMHNDSLGPGSDFHKSRLKTTPVLRTSIQFQISPAYSNTNDNRRFILVDKTRSNERILIFATDEQLQLLFNSTRIMALPFLPINVVVNTFNELQDETPLAIRKNLQPLYDYFDNYWLNTIDLEKWNVCVKKEEFKFRHDRIQLLAGAQMKNSRHKTTAVQKRITTLTHHYEAQQLNEMEFLQAISFAFSKSKNG
ncbi:unnamed protein product [Didymodactylos carnosus]|uniref:Uncharacterized protein n=1 Tax=Didymodactylos carnosus TaxID=1234261 RepID=A0A814LBP0_9BILA|nr:unnamed protein product [Didymodactylos carnosus]CAF3831674.1 unnamed protein product [Didymodactylos carnosus]